MTTVKAPEPTGKSSPLASQEGILNSILGVAIFDLNSLPKEYYITDENDNTNWVQLVFQALGLKSLLMSSLKLDGFLHISIGFSQQTAIVVRAKNDYIALLMREPILFKDVEQADKFSLWVRNFEQKLLRQNSRFIPA
jgi:predicted regulator of Ras-like GTPase activity (Roadblock/LC7/MglB family)